MHCLHWICSKIMLKWKSIQGCLPLYNSEDDHYLPIISLFSMYHFTRVQAKRLWESLASAIFGPDARPMPPTDQQPESFLWLRGGRLPCHQLCSYRFPPHPWNEVTLFWLLLCNNFTRGETEWRGTWDFWAKQCYLF